MDCHVVHLSPYWITSSFLKLITHYMYQTFCLCPVYMVLLIHTHKHIYRYICATIYTLSQAT